MLGGPPPPMPVGGPQGPLAAPMGPTGMPAPMMGMPGLTGNPMASGPNAMGGITMMSPLLQGMLAAEQSTPPPDIEKPKKPKRKKPDVDAVRRMNEELIEFWRPRDTRMKEDHELYRITQNAAGEGRSIKKNTPYVVVEKAANMLAGVTPTVHVVSATEAASETSQKIENFLRWSMERWNKQYRRGQIQGSFRHSMAHYLCLRGWVAARLQYTGGDEGYNPRSHPVKTQLVDPLQVYPMLGDDDLQYVVHRYWTTIKEVRDKWEEADKKYADRSDTEIVEVQVYYDDWYWCAIVDGDDLFGVEEHQYGFTPWVIITGNGAPIRATDTRQVGWQADVGVSLFHGIKGSYAELNRVLSQLATQVENATNPPTIYYYNPAQNAKPKPLDYTPGTTNFLFYDSERVEPMDLNPRPTEVGPLIESLVDDLNRGSLPPILWGTTGTTSGFHTSVLTDAARDALYAIVSAMQEAMEQINEFTLTLIRDHHEDEVGFWVRSKNGQNVGGWTITPEDIADVGVENQVRYRDVAPKDRAVMANLAMGLTGSNLISAELARDEYLNIENPELESQRILQEKIFMDEDVMKDSLVPMALARSDDEMLQLYMEAKMRRETQAPPGGAPAPGGPPQGGPPQGVNLGPPQQGMPPNVMPPIQQLGADPLAQSLGSIIGGQGGGGGGAPMPLPLPF
jgi:hypothetical protein